MVKKVLFLLTLGLLAGTLAFANPVTDTMQITGNIAGQVNIVVDGDIALGELVDGATGTVSVTETSNKNGYTVDLSSANGWGIRNPDTAERILYQFTYGTVEYIPVLDDPAIQITTNGVKNHTTNGIIKSFIVLVPTVAANSSAGNYSDTLTFTLSAL